MRAEERRHSAGEAVPPSLSGGQGDEEAAGRAPSRDDCGRDIGNLRFRFGGLRWLGMVNVVAVHYYIGGGNPAAWMDRALLWCNTWVSFFFLLSGFSLAWQALLPGKASEPLSSFLRRQLASVYPVYLLSLLLQLADRSAPLSMYGLQALPAYVTLSHALYPPYCELWTAGTNNYNTPSWFLSTLACGWLLLPSLARAAARHLQRQTHCAVLAALLYLVGPCGVQAYVQYRGWVSWQDTCPPGACATPWLKFFPACHLPIFALGVVGARSLQLVARGGGLASRQALRRQLPWVAEHGTALGLSGIALLACTVEMTGVDMTWLTGPIGGFFFWHTGGTAPLHALLILGAVDGALEDERSGRRCCRRIAESMGELSYCMYVLQQWTAGMLRHVINNVAPSLSEHSKELLKLWALPLCLTLVGYLAHRFVQVPYSDYLLPKSSAAGAGSRVRSGRIHPG